jgi:hypothetical protein
MADAITVEVYDFVCGLQGYVNESNNRNIHQAKPPDRETGGVSSVSALRCTTAAATHCESIKILSSKMNILLPGATARRIRNETVLRIFYWSWVAFILSIRAAQTVVYFFSTFLEFRPVSATHDVYTSINSRLEIRISKSKTPV